MSAWGPGPWALLGGGSALALIATLAGSVMAILGGELACMGGGGATQVKATRAAAQEISAGRLRIYQRAGRVIDIDWSFLASIGTQECGSGSCAGVNGSGCAGPMQISYVRGSACSPGSGPTLWDLYKTDGDGDGVEDIDNPADAIFTAARILRAAKGAPPAGGAYAAYREAACSYYGACGDGVASYAEEVMARAVRYGFGGKGGSFSVAVVGSGGSCGGSSSWPGKGGGEIVRIAQSQLGRVEEPPGSNCTRYGPCVEWCSLFVAWVWERAGVPLEGGTAPYAYSGSIYEWARAHERGGARVLAPSATPAPGDAVLFGTGPGDSDHIGIVERVFGDGQITTIDGNYGDRVARVGPFLPSRAVASGEPAPIFGYARPPAVDGDGGGVS